MGRPAVAPPQRGSEEQPADPRATTDGETSATADAAPDDAGREGEPADCTDLEHGPAWRDRAIIGIALVPFAVSAVAMIGGAGDYHPTGDLAATELTVRSIGRAPVLTGLYSRGEWSHPGPMLFYLLWPLYRLAGSTGLGLELGALAINAGAVAGIGHIARRRGGTPLLVFAMLGCALLVRSLGGGFTASYWNLHVTTLPFALLIFLVWSVACGDRWALPVATVVASFLAQTHVGFVPVALGLLAWGVLAHLAPSAVAAWRAPRTGAAGRWAALRPAVRRLLWPVAVAAGLFAVVWLLPVIDVVAHAPSNPRLVLDWFREGEDQVHTVGAGWRVVTSQFGLAGEWLVGKEPATDLLGESPFLRRGQVPWLLIPLGAACVALWRWHPRSGRPLVLTLAVTLALSIAAIGRTVGPMFDYRLRWTWVAPVVAFTATAWAAWLAVARRRPELARRLVTPVAIVALVALTGVDAVAAARVDRLEREDTDIMGALTPGVVADLEQLGIGPGDEIVIADSYGTSVWFTNGLLVQLDRRGYDARVLEGRRWQLGEQWISDGDPAVDYLVSSGRAALDQLASPTREVVATWSVVPLDDEGIARIERAEEAVDAVHADLTELAAMDRGDEAVERLAEIHRELPTQGDMQMAVVVVTRATDP